VQEVLIRVERGVRSIRAAAIVHGQVLNTLGVSKAEVEAWQTSSYGQSCSEDDCVPADKFFPVRIALVPSSEDEAPIGFILVGPRPDGSIIGKEEQRALAGVSEAIARAVRNVTKREIREKEVTDAIESNARRLSELEALLAAAFPGSKQSRRPA
jgi:K+-sensing histidine kinase KdpD